VDADFVDPLELNGASRWACRASSRRSAAAASRCSTCRAPGFWSRKALLGFLPKLCRRLLGEELKMPNVATWWCGQPRSGRWWSALDNLAIAPPSTIPGPDGVSPRPRLMADLYRATSARGFAARFIERPGDFVGQEVVRLSTTPVLRDTAVAGAVRAAGLRRGDAGRHAHHARRLLPHLRAPRRARHLHGRRCARTADVWVIADKPVERVTLLASRDDVQGRRILGHLPSRAADNLFWLGRYLERAEATLRLVRSLCTSLMDSEAALHGVGETLDTLQELLIAWGALDERRWAAAPATPPRSPVQSRRLRLGDRLVRSARRTAASMRERLSPTSGRC
jgi:hypothetical protein